MKISTWFIDRLVQYIKQYTPPPKKKWRLHCIHSVVTLKDNEGVKIFPVSNGPTLKTSDLIGKEI